MCNKFNVEVKEHSFLSDLMLSIEGRNARDKSSELAMQFSIVNLHFQYRVNRKIWVENLSVLKLLNEIDLVLEYDSSRWKRFGFSTPFEMLKKFDLKICQHVLEMMYTVFLQSVQEGSPLSIQKWSEIYVFMVSFSVFCHVSSAIDRADIR